MADRFPRVARPAPWGGVAPPDADGALAGDSHRTALAPGQAAADDLDPRPDRPLNRRRDLNPGVAAEVLDRPPRRRALPLNQAPNDHAIWKKLRKAKIKRGLAAPIRLAENQDRTLSLAIRYLPGGRKRFLEMVKLACQHNDPYAVAWWTCFESLAPVEQRRVNFDTICLGSDVPADVILGTTVAHAVRWGREAAYLVAASMQPKIMRTHVKQAARVEGIDDRRMYLSAMGFLPQKKGTQINITNQNQATAAAAARAESQAEAGLPSFLQDVEEARHEDDVTDAPALGPGINDADED